MDELTWGKQKINLNYLSLVQLHFDHISRRGYMPFWHLIVHQRFPMIRNIEGSYTGRSQKSHRHCYTCQHACIDHMDTTLKLTPKDIHGTYNKMTFRDNSKAPSFKA